MVGFVRGGEFRGIVMVWGRNFKERRLKTVTRRKGEVLGLWWERIRRSEPDQLKVVVMIFGSETSRPSSSKLNLNRREGSNQVWPVKKPSSYFQSAQKPLESTDTMSRDMCSRKWTDIMGDLW